MKIAIASPLYPKSVSDGLLNIEKMVKDAAAAQAELICFPESYIPGYPLAGFEPEKATEEQLRNALERVCKISAAYSVAIIIPMDWHLSQRFSNLAWVISKRGELLGYQTKNQLDPSEDDIWVPGTERKIFEVNGLRFGIAICHEGFRYPETVRWAARNGAHIVFHPHLAGSNTDGYRPAEWGHKDNPYYEKAMTMRALENTIYFASSNYCLSYPESGSALIAPDGTCIVHARYGVPGIIVADIDLPKATGLLARRLKKELY